MILWNFKDEIFPFCRQLSIKFKKFTDKMFFRRKNADKHPNFLLENHDIPALRTIQCLIQQIISSTKSIKVEHKLKQWCNMDLGIQWLVAARPFKKNRTSQYVNSLKTIFFVVLVEVNKVQILYGTKNKFVRYRAASHVWIFQLCGRSWHLKIIIIA